MLRLPLRYVTHEGLFDQGTRTRHHHSSCVFATLSPAYLQRSARPKAPSARLRDSQGQQAGDCEKSLPSFQSLAPSSCPRHHTHAYLTPLPPPLSAPKKTTPRDRLPCRPPASSQSRSSLYPSPQERAKRHSPLLHRDFRS